MDLLKCSKLINLKIEELESLKKQLPELAQKKSETMVAYEKKLSIETSTMAIQNTISAGLIDKIAKGNCADAKGEMDLAESAYKNCIKIVEITESQLNGYQSINRYLSET